MEWAQCHQLHGGLVAPSPIPSVRQLRTSHVIIIDPTDCFGHVGLTSIPVARTKNGHSAKKGSTHFLMDRLECFVGRVVSCRYSLQLFLYVVRGRACSVVMATFKRVHHGTSGRNHGPILKNQWLFWKEICTDITLQDCYGRDSSKKFYSKMDGRAPTWECLLHKPIPILRAMKITDAKAAVEKESNKLEKLPAWQPTKVKGKKEVIEMARKEGRTVRFATLMVLWQIKNSEKRAQISRSSTARRLHPQARWPPPARTEGSHLRTGTVTRSFPHAQQRMHWQRMISGHVDDGLRARLMLKIEEEGSWNSGAQQCGCRRHVALESESLQGLHPARGRVCR